MAKCGHEADEKPVSPTGGSRRLCQAPTTNGSMYCDHHKRISLIRAGVLHEAERYQTLLRERSAISEQVSEIEREQSMIAVEEQA